jgi:hypothetical protein
LDGIPSAVKPRRKNDELASQQLMVNDAARRQ